MSTGFKNTVFVLCIIGCLAVTALNSYLVKNDREEIHATFASLYAEAARAKQISIGQDYAMSVARVAELEASRAHELDQRMKQAVRQLVYQMKQIDDLLFQLTFDTMVLESQTNYIKLLREYIEENNLPVPSPVFEDTSKGPLNKST